MKGVDLFEIVMKLNGPVQPTGESNEDHRRLGNIQTLTELIDRLLFEVNNATMEADQPEASMKAIGVHAKEFMEAIKDA